MPTVAGELNREERNAFIFAARGAWRHAAVALGLADLSSLTDGGSGEYLYREPVEARLQELSGEVKRRRFERRPVVERAEAVIRHEEEAEMANVMTEDIIRDLETRARAIKEEMEPLRAEHRRLTRAYIILSEEDELTEDFRLDEREEQMPAPAKPEAPGPAEEKLDEREQEEERAARRGRAARREGGAQSGGGGSPERKAEQEALDQENLAKLRDGIIQITGGHDDVAFAGVPAGAKVGMPPYIAKRLIDRLLADGEIRAEGKGRGRKLYTVEGAFVNPPEPDAETPQQVTLAAVRDLFTGDKDRIWTIGEIAEELGCSDEVAAENVKQLLDRTVELIYRVEGEPAYRYLRHVPDPDAGRRDGGTGPPDDITGVDAPPGRGRAVPGTGQGMGLRR